ncbi:MAG: 30S ribosomal protein S20 [Bacilli bacterium]
MPNIKSAKKRVKVIATKKIANNLKNASMKTAIKSVEKEATTQNLNAANAKIDKACNQGAIKKNKASRLKSRLSKKVNETK